MPSRPLLKTYRFVEDAWQDGLRNWCQQATEHAFSGHQVWCVVDNRSQARWLKRRLFEEGISHFGIQFLEPHSLRRQLGMALDVQSKALGSETLEFLLRIEAGAIQGTDDESIAVSRNPGQCLAALDRLAAAGLLETAAQRHSLPAPALDWAKSLIQSGSWTPQIDRELITAARPLDIALCVVGWNARHWPELTLLLAACRCATAPELYIPNPRSTAESHQQLWIESLATNLSTEHEICDASEFESINEPLVERLDSADSADEITYPPQLLVGDSSNTQIELIRNQVVEWLAQSESTQRLGIVVTGRGPSSLSIVRRLAQDGIPLLDETGENPEPDIAVAVQRAIVAYHLEDRSADSLLRLINELNRLDTPDLWVPLAPDNVRNWLDRRFRSLQVQDCKILTAGSSASMGSKASQKLALRMKTLVGDLGSWDTELTWDAARSRWEQTLAHFELTTEVLEPLWSRIGDLVGTTPIPPGAFLAYLDAVLAGARSRLPEAATSAFSRVVVTTFTGAAHQSWDALILPDAVDGQWPIRHEENSFLDDPLCAQLNELHTDHTQGHLLSSTDRMEIDQFEFLDLLENCRGQITFAASATDPADGRTELHPNEWLMRCLVESHATDATTSPLAQWHAAIQTSPVVEADAPSPAMSHLQTVAASRQNPDLPFDQYFFNYKDSKIGTSSLSASQLDTIISLPAQSALRTLFDAERTADFTFTRSEALVVGTLVHRWLAGVFRRNAEIPDPMALQAALTELDTEERNSLAGLREAFADCGKPVPVWWSTVFRKARWIARQIGDRLTCLDFPCHIRTEESVEGAIQTDSRILQLHGRIDLASLDGDGWNGARACILDFKTGKTDPPRASKLANGNGLQFAAYYMIAKANGAARITTGIVRPDLAKPDALQHEDEDAIVAALTILASQQNDKCFGQRLPAVGKGYNHADHETLPIATVPVSKTVLDAKNALRTIKEEV